ncbi:NUDIX domain-containing protein [Actinomycetospora cinnamomea]|uniref:8-oxo-dGTP diphosphatase n=1 Tax=Actinomycetospora cinnamomea TaxID=663609 RepID=A0A2U1FFV7_9PSEU|nr:NUDIX domain-containing protein [Actinomycetospora cinnamomea]PVZ11052.1 8-oxo-dGTP diphosphatase [Actinomycetospora cinnamomea]
MEHIARAVVVRDGAVLLVEEIAADHWFFPGGHLEDGETPADALVRELREELDVGATVTEDLGRVENHWTHDGVAHHETNHVLAATIDTDDPVSQEPHLGVGWIHLGDLDTTDVRPRVLVDLVLAQARRR